MSSLLGNNILGGASGQKPDYTIDQSLRFDDGSSPYLSRTFSAGNQQVFTLSSWVKLGSKAVGSETVSLLSEYTDSNNRSYLVFGSYCRAFSENGGSDVANYSTDATYRDPSAWYHVVFSVDVTQSVAANRVKIYVNGVQEDITISTNWPEDTNTRLNGAGVHYIGQSGACSNETDGYLAEYHFIDGQALDASSFGEEDSTTGQWKPIEYTGSYGTNGFYQKYQDSSALGDDSSGNGNDFTATNLVATDQMKDSPSNNFATFNPLIKGQTTIALSEGNLKAYSDGADSTYIQIVGTIPISSGKWYWEINCHEILSYSGWDVYFSGVADAAIATDDGSAPQNRDGVFVWNASNGNKSIDGTSTSYGNEYTDGDIVGVALNMDDSEITFYKNNVSEGTLSLSGDILSAASVVPYNVTSYVAYGGGHYTTSVINFGQDSSFSGYETAQNNADDNGVGDFYYSPPSGFLALCTDNLSDPSIADPTVHMNTALYSGSTGVNQSITGVGFQPDFVWLKNRGAAGTDNGLFDSVRGVRASIYSNTDAVEQTATGTQDMYSFNSDGFSVGTNQYVECNTTGYNYVGWNWKAGGTAVTNDDGSIDSEVSANTTAGFSIVKWTGTGSDVTVGHGLSQAPDIIINKSLDDVTYWAVQSFLWNSVSDTNLLYLNVNSASSDDTNVFSAAPSASVFSPQGGAWAGIGASGSDYIAYCFHSVEGYSKIGSYTGNNNSDGPFIYTGFRPAWVMVKSYSTGGTHYDWPIYDSARSTYNAVGNVLEANQNQAEITGTGRGLPIDLLSNGFKHRSSYAENNSTPSYIYLAFAETPFKTSNAR